MPLVVAWVNKLTFSSSASSPPSPPSHIQLFVSLRYRKHRWVFGCVCHLVCECGYVTVTFNI